ncbi:hypothetical protein RI129_011645 [Pyrocoelia pectoralis]|uniref:Chitin-binding type-2 domain-containing protein n=1 Tax=Pyrocoelia pectoralis TaxID=417401 RepID=A0AAN7V4S2_9COLE
MKCTSFIFFIILGFSLGDELGFKESLTNVEAEGNRRRSVQGTSKFQSIGSSPQINAKNLVMRPIPPSSEISTIPPFKPIPPAPERVVPIPKNSTRRIGNIVPTPTFMGVVPSFNALPPSISRVSSGATIPVDNKKLSSIADKLSSTNLSIRTLASPLNNEIIPTLQNGVKSSIHALAAATNISSETIEAALLIRQQQLAAKRAESTTTTYKPPPTPPRHLSSRNKVMNAPKEYYPVGYDKNFDDNFVSRVDLPDTSFYCGDQKHFPGLYADEDLGCMVFHVCALTDDGLIMKSFLCPESTLFDQTILKCNWWFYVECKNSRKLYDSNIPVSKSYQLMKALTFFSSYRNDSKVQKSNLKD